MLSKIVANFDQLLNIKNRFSEDESEGGSDEMGWEPPKAINLNDNRNGEVSFRTYLGKISLRE